MPNANAGAKYTRRITIQQQVRTPGTMGGYTLAWTDYYTAFAKISSLKGYERIIAMQQTANQIVRFTLRWPMQHTITAGMRVAYNGNVYNITEVTDTDEGQRELVLTAELQPGTVGG